MDDLIIRTANEDDVKAIAELERNCFSAPWSEHSFNEEITGNKLAIYAVAETGGKIIGYAGIWVISGEGHVTNIAVHPDFRRKGIAGDLITTLIEMSRMFGACEYTLEVSSSNDDAISLYKSLGFKEYGIRKEYYEDNSDALIMWKTK